MKKNMKIVSGVSALAAIAILGGMAGAANAAQPDTLTIKAPADADISKTTFKAYKLAGYQDVQTDSNHVKSVAPVKVNDSVEKAIGAALDKAGVSYNHNVDNGAEDALMRLVKANDDNKALVTVADYLAQNLSSLQLSSSTSSVSGQTATLTVPDDGFYLVLDNAAADDVQPIMMSSTINGLSFADEQLGQAILKSAHESTNLKKSYTNVDGVKGATIMVGDTAEFTVTVDMPASNAYKSFTLHDDATELDNQLENASVSIDGKDAGIKPKADGKGGWDLDLSSLIKPENDQKQVTIKYDATVTGKDFTNTVSGTLTDKADHQHHIGGKDDPNTTNHNGQDDPGSTAHYANISLTKVDAKDGTTPVNGAQFTLKDEGKDGRYLNYDATAKKWSRSSAATPLTSANGGKIDWDSLAEGKYQLAETKVASGYIDANRPTADIVVDNNGKVTITGTGLNSGLVNPGADGAVTVKNLSSLSQLPQTGAAGALAGLATVGLLGMLAGATGYAARRRHAKVNA